MRCRSMLGASGTATRFSESATTVRSRGGRYRVQALVRSQGNAPDGASCPECAAAWFVIGVQWLDANDSFFGDEKNIKPADPSQNDHDWSLESFDLDAPPNATRILVWLTAHYPGRVDYDNVAVLPL